MSDNFKKIFYGVLAAFLVVVLAWVSWMTFLSGKGVEAAKLDALTPIPTLIPATLPAPDFSAPAVARCQVTAVGLLEAWVKAGMPQSEPFTFTDLASGGVCQGTFERDVLRVFNEANLWYSGAPSCTTCHSSDPATRQAGLTLSTYEGVLTGSSGNSPSTGEPLVGDILAGGDWEASRLREVLVTGLMPVGRPATVPPEGPVILAGELLSGE